jgi:hypothetical protein
MIDGDDKKVNQKEINDDFQNLPDHQGFGIKEKEKKASPLDISGKLWPFAL